VSGALIRLTRIKRGGPSGRCPRNICLSDPGSATGASRQSGAKVQGRSRVVVGPGDVSSVSYCLSATMTLLTVWPWAFCPVTVAVSVLPSAEIVTVVVVVALPSTLPMP
jgi:hypothetical protein